MIPLLILLAIAQPEPLAPGDHYRYFNQEDWRRRYLVHASPVGAGATSSAPRGASTVSLAIRQVDAQTCGTC